VAPATVRNPAAITSPGRLLLHTQGDESHPDYIVCQQIRAALEQTHDAAGRAWEIVEMPAPATLTDAEGFVDYSYINHLVVNGGVIACSYADAHDADAAAILAEQYPANAYLYHATLTGTDFTGADLRGAFVNSDRLARAACQDLADDEP
jgi:agmatine/peptidylarginine deiminase